MAFYPVEKDQCFIFNGDTQIRTKGRGNPIVAKEQTFKCVELYDDAEYFEGVSKYPAVLGVRYSNSVKKFGTTVYIFPSTEFNNIEPIDCPQVTGGRRKNRKLTKKIRRNRRRYSRRN
jgi:hypothetical protein